jgi:hypothetical protein
LFLCFFVWLLLIQLALLGICLCHCLNAINIFGKCVETCTHCQCSSFYSTNI